MRARIRWSSGWRSKSHPYWFFRRNLNHGGTFQCMWLEVFW